MGVTRKERLLKAMLSDNAEACRGGVSREERIIASVSKKVCDNDALEGGGTGGGGSGGGAFYAELLTVETTGEEITYTLDKTFDELVAAYQAGCVVYVFRNVGEADMFYNLLAVQLTDEGQSFTFFADLSFMGMQKTIIAVTPTNIVVQDM